MKWRYYLVVRYYLNFRLSTVVQFFSFGCIDHSLHLIVGPLFGQKNQGANNDGDGDDGNVEILDDTVDYDRDEVIEILDTFTDQKYLKKML